jgi:hypothetical protein
MRVTDPVRFLVVLFIAGLICTLFEEGDDVGQTTSDVSRLVLSTSDLPIQLKQLGSVEMSNQYFVDNFGFTHETVINSGRINGYWKYFSGGDGKGQYSTWKYVSSGGEVNSERASAVGLVTDPHHIYSQVGLYENVEQATKFYLDYQPQARNGSLPRFAGDDVDIISFSSLNSQLGDASHLFNFEERITSDLFEGELHHYGIRLRYRSGATVGEIEWLALEGYPAIEEVEQLGRIMIEKLPNLESETTP